jgi:hypothetical protein
MADPRSWLLVRKDELVDADRQPCFLRLRSVTTAIEGPNGERTAEGTWEFVERPTGVDAVVVVVWRRGPRGVEVLLRSGVRVPASLGRADQPRGPGRHPVLPVEELVAGLVEPGEHDAEALRLRAQAEVREEAGLDVPLSALSSLGAPLWISPGITADLMHWFSADASQATEIPARGDGSPFEAFGAIAWYPLDAAIARLEKGTAGWGDLRAELALRRFAASLGT